MGSDDESSLLTVLNITGQPHSARVLHLFNFRRSTTYQKSKNYLPPLNIWVAKSPQPWLFTLQGLYCTEYYTKFLPVSKSFGMTPEFWHHLKIILEHSSLKSQLNFWNYILFSRNLDVGWDWSKNVCFWRGSCPGYLARCGQHCTRHFGMLFCSHVLYARHNS